MEQNRAIELLKKLSSAEIKSFGEFVNSPYLNSNKSLITVYKVISKAAPEFKSRTLKSKNLFECLYPGKTFNEGTLRTRMSEFTELIRRFLVHEEFNKDKNQKADYLRDAFKRIDMPKESLKVIDKSIESAGENFKFYGEYFDRLFSLHVSKKMLVYTEGHYYKTLEGLYNMLDYNLYRFLPRFISIKTEMEAFQKLYNLKKERTLSDIFLENVNIENFITAMESEEIKHHEIFRMYYDSMQALVHLEDAQYRDRVKDGLFKNHESFNKYELYNIWANQALAYNLAVDTNKEKIYRDYFEVTKFVIEKGVFPLHEDGYLLDSEYRNIISAAVRVKEYDWAEEFAEEFKETLVPSARERAYNVVKAKCRFYKKDFESCIKYMNRVSTFDIISTLDIKTFLLLSYFELGYFEQVDSVIDALRHYVSENKKLSSVSRLEVPLFIKYCAILARAKFSGTPIGYDVFKQLEADNWFTMKSWIVEKFREYLK